MKKQILVSLMLIALLSSFPFARAAEGDYTGEHWDTSVQSGDPYGIATDGTNIWIVDNVDDEVYKYNMVGVYIDSWDTSVQSNDPYGITTDGINIWIVDVVDEEVYKYTMAGVYVDSWDISGEVGGIPPGTIDIATDGNYIWIVDTGDEEVYKYTMAGVYTTEHWDCGSQDTSPYGITTDGTYFWIVGAITEEVYKYNMAGVYTTEHWDVSSESGDPEGITTDGSNIWIVDSGDDEVYKYKYVSAGEATATKMEDAAEVMATIMVLFVIIWAFTVVRGTGKLSDIWAYLLLIAVILLIANVVGGIG